MAIRNVHLWGSLETAAGVKTLPLAVNNQYEMFAALRAYSSKLDMALRNAHKCKIILCDERDPNAASEVKYRALDDGFNFGEFATDVQVVPELEGGVQAFMALPWVYQLIIGVAVMYAVTYVSASLASSMSSGGNGAAGKKSTMFNGPVNSTDQGGPIPIVYGKKVLVGSTVIAADAEYVRVI